MKKLFRRTELKRPGYPTRDASGLSGRAVAVAGLIVATATGGCILGTSGEPALPEGYERDAGPDARPDAVYLTDSGGIAPYPDASVADAATPADAGGAPPAPDAGE